MQSLISVAWVCVAERRLLVVRTRGRDAYYLPGGKLEAGETPEAALCREVREELGIALDPLTLRPFGTFTGPAHGLGRPVELRMDTYLGEGCGSLRRGGEIAEFAWISSAERHCCAPVAGQAVDYLVAEGVID